MNKVNMALSTQRTAPKRTRTVVWYRTASKYYRSTRVFYYFNVDTGECTFNVPDEYNTGIPSADLVTSSVVSSQYSLIATTAHPETTDVTSGVTVSTELLTLVHKLSVISIDLYGPTLHMLDIQQHSPAEVASRSLTKSKRVDYVASKMNVDVVEFYKHFKAMEQNLKGNININSEVELFQSVEYASIRMTEFPELLIAYPYACSVIKNFKHVMRVVITHH